MVVRMDLHLAVQYPSCASTGSGIPLIPANNSISLVNCPENPDRRYDIDGLRSRRGGHLWRCTVLNA